MKKIIVGLASVTLLGLTAATLAAGKEKERPVPQTLDELRAAAAAEE